MNGYWLSLTQSALWVQVPLSITFSEWQTILNNFRSKSCHFICFYLFNSALHSTILYIDIHVLLNIWRDCTPVIHIVVTLWRLESDSVLLGFFTVSSELYWTGGEWDYIWPWKETCRDQEQTCFLGKEWSLYNLHAHWLLCSVKRNKMLDII